MRHALRGTLWAVGLALLVGSGVSIFWRPAHEIVYSVERLAAGCDRGICSALYRLEVGG